MTSLRVSLIGPNHQENLALRYLASASEQEGHKADIVGYNGRDDLAPAVRQILAHGSHVVGVAIPFQYCIRDAVTLIETLRKEGFTGHITCGGHVPTFCHRELLRDCPGLDSVVRHEGEQTFVALLEALAHQRGARDMEGLVWRAGAGIVEGARRAQVRDLDTLPFPMRGAQPYCVAGVPMGFVIGARGCIGECEYCSIAAFEGDSGGARYRLRKPEHIAAEIEALRDQQGTRIVFFHDDLFILPSERKAVERMDRLGAALAARGLTDLMFWVKGRPENITPAVLEAARRMGVDHVFLGVESASLERLRYLGRIHTPEDNRRALALARSHGVLPSFNFMLFDPDCTLDQVAETLRFAEDNVGLPWNVCRTEIYSGTALRTRLEGEGRLSGDYTSYGYVMRDARAELMFRVLRVCLHERAFAFDSLLNRLISLSFARQVHERFFPGALTATLSAQVRQLIDVVQRDTLSVLREVLAFAESADGADQRAVRRYAAQTGLRVNTRSLPWNVEAERLWDLMNARGLALLGLAGRTVKGALGS